MFEMTSRKFSLPKSSVARGKAIWLPAFLLAMFSLELFGFTEKKGQGTAINFDEDRGKINIPHGWVYSLDFPQTTFMTRESEERVKDYRRTMQVLRQRGAVSIDSYGAKYYADRIGKVIKDDAVRLNDFEVYEGDITTLADGTKGIVFYSGFTVNDKAMMNLHLVVSTSDNHYLITYTDLKSRFGQSGSTSPEFDEAWGIINTLSIKNAQGGSVDVWTKWFIAVAALIIGGLALNFLRRRETDVFSEEVSRSPEDQVPNRESHPNPIERSGFTVSHEDYLIQSQSKRSVSALKNVFSKKSSKKNLNDEDVDDDIEIDKFR